MARNLESWQHEIIVHMIHSRKKLTTTQMAGIVKCTERSVTHIHKNLRLLSTTRAPPVPAGRPASITPLMLNALCDYLTANLACMLRRWLYFYGTNLICCHRHPALNKLFLRKDGPKRKLSREQKNRTLNCGVSISISYLSSIHAIWFLLVSLDVING